jgi:glycosyltransferase involved in cell wall biosynthesis
MAAAFLLGHHHHRLKSAGSIVATTNGMGMVLAIAKAFRLVDSPVIVLAMGLLPMAYNLLQLYLVSMLSCHIEIACISRAEQVFLQRLLPKRPIYYIPFGVDLDFWKPDPLALRHDSYVLAVGNDIHRDWATLINSWSPNLPRLKIVTNLPVPGSAYNIEVIRGDWRNCIIDDPTMRALYQGALFVVLPLSNTVQPSGQSSCLQAMSCGRPVILSDIQGLWDKDLLIDGANITLVPPGCSDSLRHAALSLASDPILRSQIGSAGRKLVEDHFSTSHMADALARLVKDVSCP